MPTLFLKLIMDKETKNEILRLSLKLGAFTPNDKKTIKRLVAASGIDVNFKTSCEDCFNDAVLLLRKHYGITREDVLIQETNCGYRLVCTPCKVYVAGDWFIVDENMPCDEIEHFKIAVGERFLNYFEIVKNS